jgi:predicted secreted protein
VIKLSTGPAVRTGRVSGLRSKLRDERSGRVAFVSHCLLNENTRYLGGAFRPGAVCEVVDPYLRAGIGICQMPCPEQLAWGGVLKRRLLLVYGRPWLGRVIRPLLPALTGYTAFRYRFLAGRVADQIADYQDSGLDVVGVVGVDASPTCGVTTTLDLDASLGAMAGCPLNRLDRSFINNTVVNGSARPGRGLFISALDGALARRGRQVPLLGHDLRSEAPGSPLPPGPVLAGLAGRPRTQRPPASVVAAARKVISRRRGTRGDQHRYRAPVGRGRWHGGPEHA